MNWLNALSYGVLLGTLSWALYWIRYERITSEIETARRRIEFGVCTCVIPRVHVGDICYSCVLEAMSDKQ